MKGRCVGVLKRITELQEAAAAPGSESKTMTITRFRGSLLDADDSIPGSEAGGHIVEFPHHCGSTNGRQSRNVGPDGHIGVHVVSSQRAEGLVRNPSCKPKNMNPFGSIQ